MDPQQVFCPNMGCPARGQKGRGNIGVHSQKEGRYKCQQCGHTFVERRGTPLYRLQHEAALFVIVSTLCAYGCPTQAIVAAYGLDERTVAQWQARAGQHSQAVHEHLVEQPRDLGNVQADEIRVKLQGQIVWLAMALMVRTRLWLGGQVSAQRDEALLIRLMNQVRAAALARPLLFCVDGFHGYIGAIRFVFRTALPSGKQGGRHKMVAWPEIHIGQVIKQYQVRHVVGVLRRVFQGSEAIVQRLIAQNGGGKVLNTAFIERLNATFRARLAPLTRRTHALACQEASVQMGVYLIGAVYNFCTEHASLRLKLWVGEHGFRWVQRTPAMAAGIADHCWSVHELLSFHVPPPRWQPPAHPGKRSAAEKAWIQWWCA
jgi:transposase-like protein